MFYKGRDEPIQHSVLLTPAHAYNYGGKDPRDRELARGNPFVNLRLEDSSLFLILTTSVMFLIFITSCISFPDQYTGFTGVITT